MESNLLQEAFKQLEGLGALTEEDINISNPDDELDNFLKSYQVDPEVEEEETDIEIIDPETEDEEELQDSYEGKVILDCCVCHSKIYKDPSEVEVDEDGCVVNLDTECPYCYSSDGFKVVGQVESVDIPDMSDDDTVNLGDILDSDSSNELNIDDDSDIDDDSEVDDDITPDDIYKDDDTDTDDYIDTDDDIDDLDEGIAGTIAGGIAGAALGHPILGAAAGNALGNIAGNVASDVISDKIINKNEDLDESVGTAAKSTIKLVSNHWKEILAALEAVGVAYDTIQDIKNKIKASDRSIKEESLYEKLQSAMLETEDDVINVNNDNGSLNISTSKKNAPEDGDEVIAPVSDDVKDLIESNTEDSSIEEPLAGDNSLTDIDIDDVDEDSLDNVTESYLKEAYNNVRAYKTSKITEKNGQLFVEGVITFKSGNLKATKFIYEGLNTDGKGKVRLVGKNENICRGRAFTISGSVKGSKLVTESFKYNYRPKNSNKVISGHITKR